MDKAEALAYVSRLFDAAQAGAVLWGDKLLLKRYLAQCSRTGSAETQAGYHRELRHFTRWRDQHHPPLHLRELDPALVDDWVSSLREQVAAGLMKPRTYNRRVAAISSLYRWASEPARSAVTGIPRNPMPRRATYVVPKLAKPMSEDDLGMVLATIARAAATSTTARRDFVMVKGSYLLGCQSCAACSGRTSSRWRSQARFTSSVRAASPAPSVSAPPRWGCSSPWAAAVLRTGSFQVIKGMGH